LVVLRESVKVAEPRHASIILPAMRSILLCLLLPLASWAADVPAPSTVKAIPTPEFVGLLLRNGTTYVALRELGSSGATWAKLGETALGFHIKRYDANREMLLLWKNDWETEVPLMKASLRSAPTIEQLAKLEQLGDSELRAVREALQDLATSRDSAAADLAQLESRVAHDQGLAPRLALARRKLLLLDENLGRYLGALMRNR